MHGRSAQDKLSFRARLQRGDVLTAMFSIIPSPAIAEIIGISGFDTAIIDMEHGPISLSDLTALVTAAQYGGAYAMVRVPECADHVIGAVLDLGADAVLVPQIQSAAQARQAVRAARYAPDGIRGVNPWTRAARYGTAPNWATEANADVTIIGLVEGSEGLANFDEIIAVPGLDAVFLGPVDMAQSMGLPGEPEHPRVVAAIAAAVTKALARGLRVGVFARDPEGANRWIEHGVTFIGVSEDTVAIQTAFSGIRSAICVPGGD